MGNVGSISNMLSRIGASNIVTSKAEEIMAADKLILPGVGAFDYAVQALAHLCLIPVLNESVLLKKKPILGICLGMQLFTEKSEEGTLPGLDWIEAETVKFKFTDQTQTYRIPHMGWNTLKIIRKGSIIDNLPTEPRFYFVHTYHVRCRKEENVLAVTTYGIDFHSAIMKHNIVGTQFHPEKSHKYGMALLKNFAESSL